MHYRLEAQSVLKTIKRAGAGAQLKIEVPAQADRFSGVVTGQPTIFVVYMFQSEYTDSELSDPTLANGLVKVVVSPLNAEGLEPQEGIIDAVRSKGAMVEFPDGRRFSIRVPRITAPDGVTPIMCRLFLGG